MPQTPVVAPPTQALPPSWVPTVVSPCPSPVRLREDGTDTRRRPRAGNRSQVASPTTGLGCPHRPNARVPDADAPGYSKSEAGRHSLAGPRNGRCRQGVPSTSAGGYKEGNAHARCVDRDTWTAIRGQGQTRTLCPRAPDGPRGGGAGRRPTRGPRGFTEGRAGVASFVQARAGGFTVLQLDGNFGTARDRADGWVVLTRDSAPGGGSRR